MLLNIYLSSVLFSLLPKAIIRTINDIKLKRDGLYLKKYKGAFKDELISFSSEFIPSIIPGLNIISGFKSIRELIFIKYTYMLYKTRLILSDQVCYKNRDLTEDDVYEEFKNIQDNVLEGLDVDPEIDDILIKTEEINNLIFYLHKNHVSIDKDLSEMSDDQVLYYLRSLKETFEHENSPTIEKETTEEIKGETTEEKIQRLRKEKEDIINYTKDESEKKLIKK